MYLYQTGHGSHEDSSQISFSHEKQFTEDEFLEIVEACLIKAFPKCHQNKVAENKVWREAYQRRIDVCDPETLAHAARIKEVDDPDYDYFAFEFNPSMDDILNSKEYIEEMKVRGFEKAKYEASKFYWGWDRPLDGRWDRDHMDGSERDQLTQDKMARSIGVEPKEREE